MYRTPKAPRYLRMSFRAILCANSTPLSVPVIAALCAMKVPVLTKVILSGHIVVSDGELESVKNELPRHIELTLHEEGCMLFEVAQDPKHRNRFNVYEEFSDERAYEEHQKRVKCSRWGDITANVKRYYKISSSE